MGHRLRYSKDGGYASNFSTEHPNSFRAKIPYLFALGLLLTSCAAGVDLNQHMDLASQPITGPSNIPLPDGIISKYVPQGAALNCVTDISWSPQSYLDDVQVNLGGMSLFIDPADNVNGPVRVSAGLGELNNYGDCLVGVNASGTFQVATGAAAPAYVQPEYVAPAPDMTAPACAASVPDGNGNVDVTCDEHATLVDQAGGVWGSGRGIRLHVPDGNKIIPQLQAVDMAGNAAPVGSFGTLVNCSIPQGAQFSYDAASGRYAQVIQCDSVGGGRSAFVSNEGSIPLNQDGTMTIFFSPGEMQKLISFKDVTFGPQNDLSITRVPAQPPIVSAGAPTISESKVHVPVTCDTPLHEPCTLQAETAPGMVTGIGTINGNSINFDLPANLFRTGGEVVVSGFVDGTSGSSVKVTIPPYRPFDGVRVSAPQTQTNDEGGMAASFAMHQDQGPNIDWEHPVSIQATQEDPLPQAPVTRWWIEKFREVKDWIDGTNHNPSCSGIGDNNQIQVFCRFPDQSTGTVLITLPDHSQPVEAQTFSITIPGTSEPGWKQILKELGTLSLMTITGAIPVAATAGYIGMKRREARLRHEAQIQREQETLRGTILRRATDPYLFQPARSGEDRLAETWNDIGRLNNADEREHFSHLMQVRIALNRSGKALRERNMKTALDQLHLSFAERQELGETFPPEVTKRLLMVAGIRDFADVLDRYLGEYVQGSRDDLGEGDGTVEAIQGFGPACAALMMQEPDHPVWHYVSQKQEEAKRCGRTAYPAFTREAVLRVGLNHLRREQLVLGNLNTLVPALKMSARDIKRLAGYGDHV